MSSSSRKKLLLNTVSVKLGCGSCRRPKLCRIFHPKPKPKNPTYQKNKLYNHSSCSRTWGEDKYDSASTSNTTATTFSPCYVDSSQFSDSENNAKAPKTLGGFGKAGKEGVAVEKDSEDPYLDFKQSMLQMILENEIYSKDDLRELLNCFLQLNSPYHHGVIVRAFTEIWNGVFSVRSNSPRFHITRKPREF
ncbi:transcription repressor OFP6-like [Gastrolobium bilobum]|uniref:transcription repressor OFP6-like n=1 Tax=Gastrolobium bilobum TaxID=150636 RepID=UPI002AAF8B33|nr:transcription repressor OFP6-like [Gastrolobium bilobum]